MKNITKFIDAWNQAYPDFQFLLEGTDKPFNIDIRYSAEKYYGHFVNNFLSWHSFARKVGELSNDTMIVPVDDDLYARGAIEIKVICQSPNFTSKKVVEVLTWIGETLSPHRASNISFE